MKLVMSRVTEADLDELVQAQYDAFAGLDAHDALFGPNTPVAHEACKKKFIKEMRTDRADFWLKIVDQDTGRIVCASNWKIYPNWSSPPINNPTVVTEEETKKALPIYADVTWFEEGSVERRASEEIMEDFVRRRNKYCDHPHVLLNILFTDKKYQHQRCGTAMVKWGCELADKLLVSAWVEAAPAGLHLYETHGFKIVENVAVKAGPWNSVYIMMLRDGKDSVPATESDSTRHNASDPTVATTPAAISVTL